MQLLEIGGMEPLTILKMGTHNAAKMLGVLDSLGTIEANKVADMVLLNQNPLVSIKNAMDIEVVIKQGIQQQKLK